MFTVRKAYAITIYFRYQKCLSAIKSVNVIENGETFRENGETFRENAYNNFAVILYASPTLIFKIHVVEIWSFFKMLV